MSEDARALRGLSDAYAAAVDRRDLAALRACFTPHGRLAVLSGKRAPREYLGHDGLAGVMAELEPFVLTLHHVTTCHIERTADGPRGTVAGIAHHISMTEEGASDLVLHVRYEDAYGRDGDGGWRFTERLVRVLFSERRPVRLP